MKQLILIAAVLSLPLAADASGVRDVNDAVKPGPDAGAKTNNAKSGGDASKPANNAPASTGLTLRLIASGYVLMSGDAKLSEIPRVNGNYDLKALTSALQKLHAENPNQHQLTLENDPNTPYADVVAALDACHGEHFDQVSLRELK